MLTLAVLDRQSSLGPRAQLCQSRLGVEVLGQSNRPDGEGLIPHDIIYMWNLKNKIYRRLNSETGADAWLSRRGREVQVRWP